MEAREGWQGRVVGGGRIAQLLDFPLGCFARLSSGAVVAADDAATLVIEPPFRLEVGVGTGMAPLRLIESGSDADFRSLNARDRVAQSAPRNRYRIEYLESSGVAGDLRVSRVVSGDPVIVGSRFLHVRV